MQKQSFTFLKIFVLNILCCIHICTHIMYVHYFTDNGIDKDSIAHLTPDLMKELIPKVGLRIKFNKKWQQHFSKAEDVTHVCLYFISYVNIS